MTKLSGHTGDTSMPHPVQPGNTQAQFADAVLEGGGVRGIAHVGALSVAEEKGYRWRNVAGTSAGAFVAALMAADYSAGELYTIMSSLDFRRFARDRGFNWFFLREALNLLTRCGIHTGSYIEEFMREHLRAKKKSQFGDLITPGRENEPKDSRFRYRLTVIASDITSGCMLRLPQDALQYGIDPDDLNMALAVRMSASIPFFFMPINQQARDGTNCRIVDGGLLSNFPVSLFDVPGEPRHPTFGFHLVDSLPSSTNPWPVNPTGNVLQVGKALLNTMLTAHDRLYMDDHTFVRTIVIPVNGISGTSFNLSREQTDMLYQNGRTAAEQFFSTWDFEAYKIAYRSGLPEKGRRERLHAEMQRIKRMTKPMAQASQEQAYSTSCSDSR